MHKFQDFPLFIKESLRYYKVNTQDILYIEGDQDYLFIHTKNSKYNIHLTIKDMLTKIPSGYFVQVHRSFIIRLDAVHQVTEGLKEILMEKDNKRIPIGATFRKNLKDRMQTIED